MLQLSSNSVYKGDKEENTENRFAELAVRFREMEYKETISQAGISRAREKGDNVEEKGRQHRTIVEFSVNGKINSKTRA